MTDFNPDAYLAQKKQQSGFDPDAYLAQKRPVAAPEPEAEKPGIVKQFIESNVIGPARAFENYTVPFGPAIHHALVDPISGAIQGRDPDEIQKERDAYDQYLRDTYPSQEGYEKGAMAAGMLLPFTGAVGGGAAPAVNSAPILEQGAEALFRGAGPQLMSPITNQAVTHPESLGINAETGLNVAPVVLHGALNSPKYVRNTIRDLKTRPAQRESFAKYEANQDLYDAHDAAMRGQGQEGLITEVQGNLDKAAARQAEAEGAIEKQMATHKEAQYAADRRVDKAEADIKDQRRNWFEDEKQKLALGLDEGEGAHELVKELHGNFAETAKERNALLQKQGTMHDVFKYYQMLQDAVRETADPMERGAIKNMARELSNIANESPHPTNAALVGSEPLNRFRAVLQNQVPYGGYLKPGQRAMARIARTINEDLDAAVEGNEALRAKLRQQTKDYEDALELFGDKYNLSQLQSSIKDPQKAEVLKRLSQGNDYLYNAINKVEGRATLDEMKRRGINPTVAADADLATANADREKAIADYLAREKELEALQQNKLPLNRGNVTSNLRTFMLSNDVNPQPDLRANLEEYASKYHPEGRDAFWELYDKNKVLRDIKTINNPNGSRLVNLGKSVGGAIGTGLGLITGHGPFESAGFGALGAAAGAYADTHATDIYRSANRMVNNPTLSGVRKTLDAGVVPAVRMLQNKYGEDLTDTAMKMGIPIERLSGTPYEAEMMQAISEDRQKAAMKHYLMMQKDPQYKALISGGAK